MGGLRPRRWHAGGLPRSRESRPRRASRGSPVGICAGRTAPPGGRSGTNADPAPRWGAVFRVSPSAPVPVFFQVGRRLWGRASSLPVRVVEAGRAFPRECGVLGLVGSRVPDTLIPGLLGRRDALASRRPSVAPSAWSRVGERGGLRPRRWHAGGLPRSRESGPRRAPGGARSAFVLGGPLRREVVPAQMRTRHPGGARFTACCEVVEWLVVCCGVRVGTDWVTASPEGRSPGFRGL